MESMIAILPWLDMVFPFPFYYVLYYFCLRMAAWSKTKKHPGWNREGGGPVCRLFPAFLPASRLDIACILPRRAACRANSFPFCNPLFTAAATVKPKFRGVTPDTLCQPLRTRMGTFFRRRAGRRSRGLAALESRIPLGPRRMAYRTQKRPGRYDFPFPARKSRSWAVLQPRQRNTSAIAATQV